MEDSGAVQKGNRREVSWFFFTGNWFRKAHDFKAKRSFCRVESKGMEPYNHVFGLGEGVDQFFYLLNESGSVLENFGHTPIDQRGLGQVEDPKDEAKQNDPVAASTSSEDPSKSPEATSKDPEAASKGPEVNIKTMDESGKSMEVPSREQGSTEAIMEQLTLPKEKLEEIKNETLNNLQSLADISTVGSVKLPKKRAKATESGDNKVPKFVHNVKFFR